MSKITRRHKKWTLCCLFVFALALTLCQVSCEETGKDKEDKKDDLHQHSEPENEEHSEKILSRQKRYIYINYQSPIDIGFLVAVPYTFALPRFNLQTSRRRKRSIEMERELLANLTTEEIFPADSYDEPAYSFELGRMSAYFTMLGVDEDICQQKLICEIFADPENHKPLSDLFAKKLTVDHGPIAEQYKSRYYRYSRALQEGITGSQSACQTRYKRCPYSVQDRISIPALHFWTLLANTLSIELKDE